MRGLRIAHAPSDSLETLHPAYFAMVMATGIVADGAALHGMKSIATGLFGLNVLFYSVLWVAYIARTARFPRAFMSDVRSHSRGVGYFTIVAATGVLGSQFLIQADAPAVGGAFLVVAGFLLVVLTYVILTILTVIPRKPTIAIGLNGGWLLCIVATQSVSRLFVLAAGRGVFDSATQEMMFVALVLWLGGGALYLWIMTLIFFRYTFLPMSPTDLTPPYWINMGAVAISALAGLTLVEHANLSPIVLEILPFAKGFTLFFWSIGSWWIPMLLLLGVWRYVLRSIPFSYDPLYWGAVFPLGMYSVSTFHLTIAFDAQFLNGLSIVFLYIAMAAWLATSVGFVDSLLGGKRPDQAAPRLSPSDTLTKSDEGGMGS